ncbi:replication protein [Actinobacillus equuli subsp. haemolyticus]|uniref:replication protein n=1 Tax=Actinobacillus equuli TaxID=718 RepID=UPI002418B989|nr:replication protein [Actinobacillus equuli]MDG4948833.1 replication protein [Actinobacillus equuli subsp. haemolyticus]
MALPQSQQQNKPILRLHQNQEAKKVSVDDGYTAIPNELLFAMGRFPFTQRQYAVILAVIQKTLSWRKEMDWICNEQLCELTGIKGEHKVSAVKNALVRMKVLTQKGRKIGLNLIISEWENPNLPEKGNLTQKGKTNLPEKGNRVYPKQVTTKETITKEKINNPPIVPQGDSSAEQDEDLAKAKKSKSEPVDYDGVMQAWNDVFADTPIAKIKVMNEQRKRQVHRLAKDLRAEFGTYSAQAFADYFADFWQQINRPNSWYLRHNSRKWMADFEYVMKPKTFAKTVEDAL